MLSIDESAELRALQGRAYGRGGGLTADELDRLRSLERRRAPAAQPPIADPVDEPRPAVIEAVPSSNAEPAHDEPVPATASDLDVFDELRADQASDAASSAAGAPRRRGRIVGALALALAVGIGVGWLLFGWDSAAFLLNAAHSDQRAELEASGDYDPGTVTAVAEQHGAVGWRATRDAGDQQCAIITFEDESTFNCESRASLEQGGIAGTVLTLPVEDGKQNSLWFSMVTALSGDIMPVFQLSPSNYDWTAQYSEEELAAAGELEAQGFIGENLSIVGYDGDMPVWTAWTNEGSCLMAGGGDLWAQSCGAQGESLDLEMTVDGTRTTYSVVQTEMRGPQLTITRAPEQSER